MGRVSQWFLLKGNRLAVAGGVSVIVFFLMVGLVEADVILVGPGSKVPTVFGSGITAGVFTLVTVTLSVNQLILSRVFGTVSGLTDRLDGALDFRRSVADIVDQPGIPNDPAAFLSLLGESLHERVETLDANTEDDSGLRDDFDPYVSDMFEYADTLGSIESEQDTLEIVSVVLNPMYAQNMAETERLRQQYANRLSETAETELDAILDLLKSIAVVRQFLKTVAIQQNLARLSQTLAYFGFPALLVAYSTTLLYSSRVGVAVPAQYLPWVVSLAIAVVTFPLAILLVYILRIATITRFTISVGPFVPVEEKA